MHWGKILNSDLNRANNLTSNLTDPVSGSASNQLPTLGKGLIGPNPRKPAPQRPSCLCERRSLDDTSFIKTKTREKTDMTIRKTALLALIATSALSAPAFPDS